MVALVETKDLAAPSWCASSSDSEIDASTPHDPATFAAVAFFMGVAALVAAWVPARRSARVDPVIALRAE